MERTTTSLSEEELSKFLYLKSLLLGTKTPSKYMEIIIEGFKQRKRQIDSFYGGTRVPDYRIEDKLKKIAGEIRMHLRENGPKIPAQKSDTRFIHDSMLVAEATELVEGSFEDSNTTLEVRLAGFGLNIDNQDLNAEIGVVINNKNDFCFFYRSSSTDTPINRIPRDYTNYYPTLRMNSYDINLASWIINTYKEASLIPQPNGTPPHSFAFPNL